MPEIVIGARAINYDVRRSTRAARKRIEISSRGVQVVVPEGASTAEVERFVERKRRWLHDKTAEIREELDRLKGETPRGFHSGAKVLFRGRHLKLRVSASAVGEPTIFYRTGFHVELPRDAARSDYEPIARAVVEKWLEQRLAKDAWEVVRLRGSPHGLEPSGIRIKDQRTLWGSCGRDGIIRLDSKLVRLPKAVLEYVIVHELCHLLHRDHSAAFWGLVRRVLPDYAERKSWLETHEVTLG